MPGNKKMRCAHIGCNKRIREIDVIISKCKCGNHYCVAHRMSELHDCSYNYKMIDTNAEISKLKCVSDRIEKI
jgi:predicted nucleic acid binding AN1-type Zn finger protein